MTIESLIFLGQWTYGSSKTLQSHSL